MEEHIDVNVKKIVADIFNIPYAKVSEDSSPKTIDNWDSMQLLNLIIALEQNYSISLSPEDVSRITDVRSIIGLIEQRIKTR